MREVQRQIYCFDGFQVDEPNRQLLHDGQHVPLPKKAFDLLLILIESNGQAITKDELLQRVWPDQFVEEANLTVQIAALRKALCERKDEARYILTIPKHGYRFVADIKTDGENDELVIEQHTTTRVVVEHETFEDGFENGANMIAYQPTPNGAMSAAEIQAQLPLASSWNKQKKSRYTMFAAGALICVFLAFAGFAYRLYKHQQQSNKALIPFGQINIKLLTNNGKVAGATVSSDGKYVAYVLSENEGNSLWAQQIGTASDIRLLPPTKSQFWGLTFSPDGTYIYYNLFEGNKIDIELFRVPLLGGAVEKIPNVSTFSVTFSPDGKRIAYIKTDSPTNQNHLVVADANGSNREIIATKKHPNTFILEGHAVAWSPDGETIACLINQFEADANYSSAITINLKDKTEKLLSAHHWYDVGGIEWAKNGDGLFIAAKDKLSARSQIWLLPHTQGEPKQITNDLNNYEWLSVTADGKSLVTLQTNTINSISIGELNNDAGNFKEIASEVSDLYPLVWTTTGKIIFRSAKDGVSNLWIMNADGTERRQLTINAQVDFRGLCVSPDGKYIVFVSWRLGKSNLWRIDADGTNLQQLTDDEADAYPQCLPDNRTVIYQKGIYAKPMLWKTSLYGGEPVRLTDFRAKWPTSFANGSRVSFFQMADIKWQIGVFSYEDTSVLQRVDVPANLRGNTIQWLPDNQSLFYMGVSGNVGNIWLLRLDGTPPKPITNFTSHTLSDFSLSPDGKHLAVTRSQSLSDVVLIENTTSQ